MNHMNLTVSTHSRPKAAGKETVQNQYALVVSTHSRPKAAGQRPSDNRVCATRFNTQPPEGGWLFGTFDIARQKKFQHTAARRRLAELRLKLHRRQSVSTHSRPKAAGLAHSEFIRMYKKFQHTAARRRLVILRFSLPINHWFQHTAARRRLGRA